MDPDFALILVFLIFFFVVSIYCVASLFKRSTSVTGRQIIGLIGLLISALLFATIPYYFIYTFQDFQIILYYVVIFLSFCISLNLSQLITRKIVSQHKSQKSSITFCFLSIVLPFIIFLVVFYSVRLIDNANLLGNE
jgi:hypothetical protein